MFGNLLYYALTYFGETREIDTMIFGTLKDDCHGTIIFKIIVIVVNILLGGILVAGTAGMIWSGVQIISAADNASRLASAKKRIIDIIIGILAYGFMYVILNLVIPGGMSLDVVYANDDKACPEHTIVGPVTQGDSSSGSTSSTTSGQGGCMGNTVEKDGYCYAKTKIMAYDYANVACDKHGSCQSYKESEWGSSCAMVAAMNAGEMIKGFSISGKHTSITSPASYSKFYVSSPNNEDNVSMLYCNGSLSRATTKPGSRAINRIAYKRLVKKIVEELEKGKPITVQVGVDLRGKKYEKGKGGHRHFVTIVAVSKELNSSNVDNVVVEFESGDCFNARFDQPIVTIDGKRIHFRYIDPWNSSLKTFDENGSRLWRLNYDMNAWYGYTY